MFPTTLFRVCLEHWRKTLLCVSTLWVLGYFLFAVGFVHLHSIWICKLIYGDIPLYGSIWIRKCACVYIYSISYICTCYLPISLPIALYLSYTSYACNGYMHTCTYWSHIGIKIDPWIYDTYIQVYIYIYIYVSIGIFTCLCHFNKYMYAYIYIYICIY